MTERNQREKHIKNGIVVVEGKGGAELCSVQHETEAFKGAPNDKICTDERILGVQSVLHERMEEERELRTFVIHRQVSVEGEYLLPWGHRGL